MNFENVEIGKIYKCSQKDFFDFYYIFFEKKNDSYSYINLDCESKRYAISVEEVSREKWNKIWEGNPFYIYSSMYKYHGKIDDEECKKIIKNLFKKGLS